eukprot:m.9138 g.9138  ORF g.9138 m.9138 type:complete len:75 (-) comp6846_c0_seq2:3176-3400(-)
MYTTGSVASAHGNTINMCSVHCSLSKHSDTANVVNTWVPIIRVHCAVVEGERAALSQTTLLQVVLAVRLSAWLN